MAVPARYPRAAVAGIGGQQLGEDGAAELQHPGADHRLSRLQPGPVAAQRPGSLRCQAAYLGGLLPREGFEEPPFSASGTGGASVPPPAGPRRSSRSPPRSARRSRRTPHAGRPRPAPYPPLPRRAAARPSCGGGRPGPQEPWPVARVIRVRARAVRLPAPALVLAHRPPAEVADPASCAYRRSRSASSSASDGSDMGAPRLVVESQPDSHHNQAKCGITTNVSRTHC